MRRASSHCASFRILARTMSNVTTVGVQPRRSYRSRPSSLSARSYARDSTSHRATVDVTSRWAAAASLPVHQRLRFLSVAVRDYGVVVQTVRPSTKRHTSYSVGSLIVSGSISGSLASRHAIEDRTALQVRRRDDSERLWIKRRSVHSVASW